MTLSFRRASSCVTSASLAARDDALMTLYDALTFESVISKCLIFGIPDDDDADDALLHTHSNLLKNLFIVNEREGDDSLASRPLKRVIYATVP